MNRREFVKDGMALGLATRFAPALGAAKPKRRPNVLYVFSDEHRACSLPGQPYSNVLAPNITKFAKENLSFRNCISNYPVCSPYRGIFITGLWPYQSGIIDNRIQLRPNSPSVGRTFCDSGYYTGYIGKWHLSSVPGDETFIPPGPARQGFEDWHVWANTNPHFNQSFTFDPETGRKIQPKGYDCALMTDQAVTFLKERKADPKGMPWLLVLSWNPPHPPFDDAPPEEMKLYNPNKLPLRPNVKLVPKHSRFLASEERLRAADQGYSAHITAVDKEFGRVLQALEDTGQAEDTIVVYTSDHGEMMGSQGYTGKRLPWEESCKPPFFIRYPGVTPAAHASEILFSAVDIYPSLCGLAGIPVPKHCVGRDLSQAMRGGRIKLPESAFLMHIQKEHASGGNENPAPLFRGVRTARNTYAVADDGRWCLYDNREDPYQEHNLIRDKSRAALMRELDAMVRDWLKKASDPFPYDSLLHRWSIHSGHASPHRSRG